MCFVFAKCLGTGKVAETFMLQEMLPLLITDRH